jgi:hypothetical protein
MKITKEEFINHLQEELKLKLRKIREIADWDYIEYEDLSVDNFGPQLLMDINKDADYVLKIFTDIDTDKRFASLSKILVTEENE